MEKYRCKLCSKSFSNGRALGGHMRSHMMKLSLNPKPDDPVSELVAPSPSLSSFFIEQEHEQKATTTSTTLSYELRENPKRSIRFIDPEFSFTIDTNSSVILQDRESETESSKNMITRQNRSKRARKSNSNKVNDYGPDSWTELDQPMSSISEIIPDEDVAFCLMMLSVDKWKKQDNKKEEEEEEETEEEDEEQSTKTEEVKFRMNRTREKFRCDTCNKYFRSYQALGGHRASHKKMKKNLRLDCEREYAGAARTSSSFSRCLTGRKIHECPFCYRVFASGQALGGHKRSHGVNTNGFITANCDKKLQPGLNEFGNSFIDLNLPAPIEDENEEQFSRIEVSDVLN